MSFFPRRPNYIGIEADGSSFKAAVLRKNRTGWEVAKVKEFPRQENVNPLDMFPKESLVVTAITSQEVLVRSCEMVLKKERDVMSALDFHVEPLLPYPSERAVIQAQIIKKHEKGTSLTTFAVRKDHIQAHLERMRPIDPETITCVPYALAALSTLLPPASSPILLVHANSSEVSCALVENGKLLASRAFGRELDLQKEIRKTVLSISSGLKDKPLSTIFLLGTDPSLSETIQEATGVSVLFPFVPVLGLSQEELTRFGLAIGIALAHEGVNFRQKEFSCDRSWKRLKKPFFIYASLVILLSGLLFTYEQSLVASKKIAVQQALGNLFSEEKRGAEVKTFKTPYGYMSELSGLEKEIQGRPDTFPLFPLVPKAQDIIAWVSSQPQLANKDGALIAIESLHYVMVKRPDFSNKKEHYKVKVDLEFSAKNPTAASLFQNVLMTPNHFVDSKEEVQWTAGKGKYRAIFYLQDKTRYT